jgi:hypothetical protein
MPIDSVALSAETQIVIDGYEQLSWWSKLKVRRLASRTRAGLLATAHKDVGLPTVYETKPSEEVALAVAARLLAEKNTQFPRSEITGAYQAANGNVRETLFKLFDVYQTRNTV